MSKKSVILGKPENHLVVFQERVNRRPASADFYEETTHA